MRCRGDDHGRGTVATLGTERADASRHGDAHPPALQSVGGDGCRDRGSQLGIVDRHLEAEPLS